MVSPPYGNACELPEFHMPLPSQPCSAAYHDKAWAVFFQKQVRYGFATLTDFELHPLACKNVTTVQIRLKCIPSFTDQTHNILTHCINAADYDEQKQ